MTVEEKAYLQALANGTLPENRPTFNNPDLDETIRLVEETAIQSKGNKRAVENTIQALSRTNAALKNLVDEPKQSTNAEIIDSGRLVPPLPPELVVTPEQTQGLCPAKDTYIRYSMEASPEGYAEFHPTCFWSTVSTIAGRRIAIDMARKLYTPLTVVLAARTSMYKKTVTAEVSRDVLRSAGLEWMLGLTKTTPQKLLSDMSGPVPGNYDELSKAEQEAVKLRLAMSAQRGWIYNEFGKLIKAMHRSSGPMAEFVEFLLIMDDCPSKLEYGTHTRGNECIDRPYLSLLGTLTPASIKAHAGTGSEMWNDGFFARILFSCPPPDTGLDKPFGRGEISVPPNLSTAMRQLHKRLGVPELDLITVLDEEGKKTGRYIKTWTQELSETKYKLSDATYSRWAKYRSALKQIARSMNRYDLDGSYERMPNMALRVAALAAALEGNSDYIIHEKHWLLGQEQAEMWRASLHELYAQINSDVASDPGPTLENILLDYLKGIGKDITARGILTYGPSSLRKLKSNDIRDLLNGMVKDGVVEKKHLKESKAEWYKFLNNQQQVQQEK